MGAVYRAVRADGVFEQTAALKLVRPGLADALADRFRTERQILAGLSHPGVARLLDGGVTDDGRPWLAMEYVDGEPITAYCDRHRLGIGERLALFVEMCDVVAYAHRSLVVHRDLKPSNVLVTAGPPRQVKLLDFGVATLLADGPASVTGSVSGPTRRATRRRSRSSACPSRPRPTSTRSASCCPSCSPVGARTPPRPRRRSLSAPPSSRSRAPQPGAHRVGTDRGAGARRAGCAPGVYGSRLAAAAARRPRPHRPQGSVLRA